ncbi:hypothetical protein ACFFSH_39565 [Streptomyces filamentosus]|uniref:Uncharacterized protein n=1 Tax=Streptomyces filamentosus TaxID=67294 RepID=A0A919BV17_STRFL|nr:hypothetical protein [Streptomyces filamentosus]GHG15109.1 hypothetical protein GCM10017667_55750 [Streptomyces filamentosus]
MPKPSLRGRLVAAVHNAGARVAGDKGTKAAGTITATLLGVEIVECGPTCGDHCADYEHTDTLRRLK